MTRFRLFLRLTMAVLAVCLMLVLLVRWGQKDGGESSLPFLGHVQPFELQDQHGNVFSSKELDGRVWLVDFFFTTCASICPVMTKNMAALDRSFAREPDVHFVSITVNPEQDSPEALSRYAQRYHAGHKWRFLTGDRETIQTIAVRSFHLGQGEEPVFHSPYFVLIDRQGRIRGYFDGTDDTSVSKAFQAIARLLKEESKNE